MVSCIEVSERSGNKDDEHVFFTEQRFHPTRYYSLISLEAMELEIIKS